MTQYVTTKQKADSKDLNLGLRQAKRIKPISSAH